jgi:hypothetical protein
MNSMRATKAALVLGLAATSSAFAADLPAGDNGAALPECHFKTNIAIMFGKLARLKLGATPHLD